MSARNPLREDELEDAAKFFNAVILSYWDGTLSRKRDMLETMPGCRPFFRCAEGYSYGWWLQELMDSASPLLQGFSLSWGEPGPQDNINEKSPPIDCRPVSGDSLICG